MAISKLDPKSSSTTRKPKPKLTKSIKTTTSTDDISATADGSITVKRDAKSVKVKKPSVTRKKKGAALAKEQAKLQVTSQTTEENQNDLAMDVDPIPLPTTSNFAASEKGKGKVVATKKGIKGVNGVRGRKRPPVEIIKGPREYSLSPEVIEDEDEEKRGVHRSNRPSESELIRQRRARNSAKKKIEDMKKEIARPQLEEGMIPLDSTVDHNVSAAIISKLESQKAFYLAAYELLDQELTKAQIEESVLTNIKMVVHSERQKIRNRAS